MFSFLLGGHRTRHKPYIPLYKSYLNLLYLSSQICIRSVGKSGFSVVLWITSLISAAGCGLLQDCGMATSTFTKDNGRWGSNGTMQWKLENQFQGNLHSVAGELARGKHEGHWWGMALSWASCIFWCHKALGEIIVLGGVFILICFNLILMFLFFGGEFSDCDDT
jgi:hypothetical protein